LEHQLKRRKRKWLGYTLRRIDASIAITSPTVGMARPQRKMATKAPSNVQDAYGEKRICHKKELDEIRVLLPKTATSEKSLVL